MALGLRSRRVLASVLLLVIFALPAASQTADEQALLTQLTRQPEDVLLLLELTRLYEEQRRVDEALQMLRRAQRVAVRAASESSGAEPQVRSMPPEEVELQRRRREQPDDVGVLVDLARFYFQHRQFADLQFMLTQTEQVLAGVPITEPSTVAPVLRTWQRLDSPNFVVIGDLHEEILRGIAAQFERFRETLGRILPAQVTTTPVPTVVAVFSSSRAFGPFAPLFDGRPVEMAGLFVPGRDMNYIAVVNDGQTDWQRIVFHEYAHLILENLGRDLPAWLREGLAEFYSTFDLDRDGRRATLGRPLGDHLARLANTPALGLDELLGVDQESPLYNEGDRRSVFYAQAWALTHMIILGDPPRSSQLLAYLAHLSDGAAASQAWQTAFGSEDIANDLQRYIRRPRFRVVTYTLSDELTMLDAPVASLSWATTRAHLARFYLQQGRNDEASALLADAAELDGDNPAVRLGLATVAVARGDLAAARAQLESLEAGDDWLLAYQAGVAVADLAEAGGDADESVAKARQFFDQASAARPAYANALARLAGLEVLSEAGPTPETLAAVERARALAAGRHDYALLHAQLLVRRLEFDRARAVLEPMLTPQYPQRYRDAAEALMARLVEFERAIEEEAARPASRVPGVQDAYNLAMSSIRALSLTAGARDGMRTAAGVGAVELAEAGPIAMTRLGAAERLLQGAQGSTIAHVRGAAAELRESVRSIARAQATVIALSEEALRVTTEGEAAELLAATGSARTSLDEAWRQLPPAMIAVTNALRDYGRSGDGQPAYMKLTREQHGRVLEEVKRIFPEVSSEDSQALAEGGDPVDAAVGWMLVFLELPLRAADEWRPRPPRSEPIQ